MSFLNKSQAISNLTTNITSDSDPNLQPSIGLPIKSGNLQNYIQNLLDWIFPPNNNNIDLRGKVLDIPNISSTAVTDYSGLDFITVMPLAGICQYALNGYNKDLGAGKIRAVTNPSINTVLDGFLFLDGQSIDVSLSDNSIFRNLKTKLEGLYGNTSADNTLRLPDMRNKVSIGYNKDTALTPNINTTVNIQNYAVCGNIGGKQSTILTINQLPTHNHLISLTTSENGLHTHFHSVDQQNGVSGAGFATIQRQFPGIPLGNGNDGIEYTSNSGDHTHSIFGNSASTGNNAPIDNRMEYMILNYIIKY